MRVDGIEQAQREGMDGSLRLCAVRARIHRAGDDGIAGSSQQIALVGNVPINSTRTGGEPFGQRAEGQTAFTA